MSVKAKPMKGCLVTIIVIAAIMAVCVTIVGVAFFHAPDLGGLVKRLDKAQDMGYYATPAQKGEEPNLFVLSVSARRTLRDLQSCYDQYMREYEGATEIGLTFAVSGVVEYFAVGDLAEAEVDLYGLVVYTDSHKTALEVWHAYHKVYSDNHDSASQSDYYLFVRGNAVIVGNADGLVYAYVNSLF